MPAKGEIVVKARVNSYLRGPKYDAEGSECMVIDQRESVASARACHESIKLFKLRHLRSANGDVLEPVQYYTLITLQHRRAQREFNEFRRLRLFIALKPSADCLHPLPIAFIFCHKTEAVQPRDYHVSSYSVCP